MLTDRIKIISIGIIVPALITICFSGCGSLIRASANGDIHKMKKYLEEGEDVNTADKSGMTPIMWAIYYGNKNAAEFLIKNGAEVNYRLQKDFSDILVAGSTPLMIASYYQYTGIVTMLINYGADKNIKNANDQDAYYLAQKYNFYAGQLLLSSDKGGKKFDQYAFLPTTTISLNNGKSVMGKVISQDKNGVKVKTNSGFIELNKNDILFLRIDEN